MLGPASGAIVLGFLGYPAVFAVNAVSFVVSGCLVVLLSVPSHVPSGGSRATADRLTASVAEGARFVRQNRNVVIVLVVVTLVHFVMGGLSAALPFLARSLNGSGASNLGYLEAFLGVGIVAGSLILSRMSNPPRVGRLYAVLISLGAILCVAGLLQATGVLGVIPFLACTAAIGAGIAVAVCSWETVLQRETPDAFRGRVFVISTTVGNVSVPLGMALCGLALGRVSFGTIFGPGGIALVLAGMLLCVAMAKSRQPARAGS